MEKVYVDKYNASDDSFDLTEINFENGSKVEKADIIFSIESSKADIDIESQHTGYIYYDVKLNDKVFVGDLFYIVSNEKLKNYKSYFINNADNGNADGIIISFKARILIENENINPIDIGKPFIKESDVINYLKTDKGIIKVELSEKVLQEINNVDANKDVLIIGGAGGCKMVIDAIKSCNTYNIRGIIDNEMNIGEEIMGHKIIGNDSNLNELFELGFRNIVLSFSILGNLKLRRKKYEFYSAFGFNFPNIIHKDSIIEQSVKLGYGNLILAGSVLGSEVSLENFNYINTGSIICHESKVGNNNHFAPNSVIAGRVQIGNNVLVGMCVTTYFDIKIGDNVVINNGVNIINDIEDNQIIKRQE